MNCFFCQSDLIPFESAEEPPSNLYYKCQACSSIPDIRNVQCYPHQASFQLEFQNRLYMITLDLEKKETEVSVFCGKGLFEILLEFPGTFLSPTNIIPKLKLYQLFS